MIKTKLEAAIKKAAKEKVVSVVETKHASFGDYSTNIALVMAQSQKKDPMELAEQVVQRITKEKEVDQYISKIEVKKPGFINFWLSEKHLLTNVEDIIKQKDNYGKPKLVRNKKVIVEYSSPNIAKPFSIGHFRSTVIGDAVANILEFVGWNVYRDNHIGDWGTQFGKQIYAIKAWGDEKQIDKSKNPVKELVGLYVKFHEEAEKNPTLEDEARKWFKKLEDGDSEARNLWSKCVNWSWKEFGRIYSRLGVEFSPEFNDGKGLGESFFEDKMEGVIRELEEKDMLKSGEGGARLVFFDDKKLPPAMILKKDGATLYHTRDLATDRYRKDHFNPDLIINEVGMEQALYFKQLFEMEKMLGWYKGNQRVHISHALVRFKDKKMSTRKGNVIWLQDILEEAQKRAMSIGQARIASETDEIAESVAIGALKYNDLKRDADTDMVFDWDDILNMRGNSGPYIQYTYARAESILRKAKNIKEYDSRCEGNNYPEELIVMRRLAQFQDTIIDVAKNYSPSLLCTYLFSLASEFNTFYDKHKIIGSEKEESRLKLTKAVGVVIKNGLALLGIDAPSSM